MAALEPSRDREARAAAQEGGDKEEDGTAAGGGVTGEGWPGWATGCRSKPASSFAAQQGKAFHVALSIGIPGTSQSAFVPSKIKSRGNFFFFFAQGDPQISAYCSGGKLLKSRGNREGQWMSFKNKMISYAAREQPFMYS